MSASNLQSSLPDSSGVNLAELFCRQVDRNADRRAVRFRQAGAIRQRTWGEFAEDAYRLADGLRRLGVASGDRVAQLSENRYEWMVADVAIHLARAIHVPIHAPLAAPQVAYQIEHSESRVVLVSGEQQQAKLGAAAEAGGLGGSLSIIHYERATPALSRWPRHALDELMAASDVEAGRESADVARRTLQASDLATILYTSGTTGQPKGVMLDHRNLVTNAVGTNEAFGMQPDYVRLCFLPLSHIFARTCDFNSWIALGYYLDLATSRDTVLDDCQWSQPHILSGVPYFFDRLHRLLRERGEDQRPGSLRELLGGQMRYCCTGGAALPDHTFDFYEQQGLPLLQGYGLSESSPVISMSTPRAVRRGASGLPIRDVEVRISDEGEITSRGPHIMRGYWKDPDATAAILRDGWLLTGDLGHVDDGGFVWITGRKKELIVTAAGKNIAPVLLESLLTEDPLIDQALVVGDGRNYLAALLVPNAEEARRQLPDLDWDASDFAWREEPAVLERFQQAVDARLACVSYHEQVRRFALLPRPFSIEEGEMTAKLSLRRPIIQERFATLIDGLYQQPRR